MCLVVDPCIHIMHNYVGQSTLLAAIIQMIIGFGVVNAPEDGSRLKVTCAGCGKVHALFL